jgi:hypothetical protein
MSVERAVQREQSFMALPFDQRCFAAPDAGGSTTPPPGRLPIISADERLAEPRTIPDEPPDVICIDPIRNLFDGGPEDSGENSNNAMLFFLQERVEVRVYTGAQFADRFENQGGLGGKDTIRERLGVLTTKGYVKFFRDHDAYGLPPATRSKFGYLCVEGMHLGPLQEAVDSDKRHITGKGNATKEEVIAAVRAKGFSPVDDNDADALALLDWAVANRFGGGEQ